MGYDASSHEVDFTVPPENVPAALAAMNAAVTSWSGGYRNPGAPYKTLCDAVEETTSFQECDEDPENGFTLGYHSEKYMWKTDEVLRLLARYATDGSYVRLLGEDGALFGMRVVGGLLFDEDADIRWRVCGPNLRDFVKVLKANSEEDERRLIFGWEAYILNGSLAHYCPSSSTGFHTIAGDGTCEVCGSLNPKVMKTA